MNVFIHFPKMTVSSHLKLNYLVTKQSRAFCTPQNVCKWIFLVIIFTHINFLWFLLPYNNAQLTWAWYSVIILLISNFNQVLQKIDVA